MRIGRKGLLFLTLSTACTIPAMESHAVILSTSANRNTTEPPAGNVARAGWNLSGEWDTPLGALGKYLGTPISEQHFITANHIGGSAANTFKFAGQTYTIDPAYGAAGSVTIPNSDLRIWKVNQVFPDYAVLHHNADEMGKHLGTIGRGTPRGGEVRDGANILKGWLWGVEDGVKSWGENDVTAIATFAGLGDMLRFEFNAGAGKPNESHLSAGDSGGGVFVTDNGVSKLAGINFSTDGPYSTSSTGASPFFAALTDRGGFYEQRGDGSWQLTSESPLDKPGSSYASRISNRWDSISAAVPGLTINRTAYTANTPANVGKIDASSSATIGSTVRAYYMRTPFLLMNPGGKLLLRADGSDRATSVIGAFGVGANALFDLNDNKLIARSGNINELRSSIIIGRGATGGVASGKWDGEGGLTSSAAAADFIANNRETHSLGYALNSGLLVKYSTFGGQTAGDNDVLVRYTRNGDANLDGIVNNNDITILAGNYRPGVSGKHWYQADFNYDGMVDNNDITILAGFYSPTAIPVGASISPTSASNITAADATSALQNGMVPEPGTLATLAGSALLLLRRRRR